MQKAILIAAAVLAVCSGAFAAQNFERDEGWVLYSNAGAAISSGGVVDLGDRYGIAKVDIASNATGVVATKGIWVLTLATNQTISVGDKLYWNSVTSQATETATAAKLLGVAVTAVTTVASTGKVQIDLNPFVRQVVVGVDVQAYDADLGVIAGLSKTANNFIMANGSAWTLVTPASARTGLGLGSMALLATNAVTITGGYVSGITDIAVADGGTGASTAAAARSNLGVGSMGTLATNAATITGGYVVGITDIAVADGGTGASTASAARTNLGLGTVATQNVNAVAFTGGTIAGTTITGGSVGGLTLAAQTINITGIATNTVTAQRVIFNPTGATTNYFANPGAGITGPVFMYNVGSTAVVILETGNITSAGDLTLGQNDTVIFIPASSTSWVQASAVLNN